MAEAESAEIWQGVHEKAHLVRVVHEPGMSSLKLVELVHRRKVARKDVMSIQ